MCSESIDLQFAKSLQLGTRFCSPVNSDWWKCNRGERSRAACVTWFKAPRAFLFGKYTRQVIWHDVRDLETVEVEIFTSIARISRYTPYSRGRTCRSSSMDSYRTKLGLRNTQDQQIPSSRSTWPSTDRLEIKECTRQSIKR